MAFSRAPVLCVAKISKEDIFLSSASMENVCRMIKKTPSDKARDILVACRRREEGRGMRSIARELMMPCVNGQQIGLQN